MKRLFFACILVTVMTITSGPLFALGPWQPDKAKPDKIFAIENNESQFAISAVCVSVESPVYAVQSSAYSVDFLHDTYSIKSETSIWSIPDYMKISLAIPESFSLPGMTCKRQSEPLYNSGRARFVWYRNSILLNNLKSAGRRK